VVIFLFALLLICAVALSVVAAFALPHLRAGSPLLTDRGERLARRVARRLRPVTAWVWPRLRRMLRPLARLSRRAARPAVHAMRPAMDAVRPRIAPVTSAIARAVEEGSGPIALGPRRPRREPDESVRSPLPARTAIASPQRTASAPLPQRAAPATPLARR
jgi:hypothetical protein